MVKTGNIATSYRDCLDRAGTRDVNRWSSLHTVGHSTAHKKSTSEALAAQDAARKLSCLGHQSSYVCKISCLPCSSDTHKLITETAIIFLS
jgi:hypothetical protein